MKKIISLVLALMLIASFSLTAFAAGETGSITINGASEGNTYTIYKLLDLASYDKTDGTYVYKVAAKWTAFFETQDAKDYFTTSENGYVSWSAAEDDDTVAAFAKKAMEYAKANGIVAEASTTPGAANTVIKFENLALGYYLVDSTMGALCGLTTTNPDAVINAKNHIPTIDKQVLEDSTSQWGGNNTADIGQIVEFRVTINVHAGAENYVLHDAMEDGFTFQSVSKVEHVIPGVETHNTDASKYTVKTTGIEAGCDFEVTFTKELCDSLENNDKLIIYYTAMLNRNAKIAEDNVNTAWLTFGDDAANHKSNIDSTYTRTYAIDIVKTDSEDKLIDGAEFKIYNALTGGEEIKVVLMADGETYRLASAGEAGESIVVKDGKVRVVGFDNGTYYLQEIIAPDGYELLAARVKFIISDANLNATFTNGIYSTGSGVHIINKTGARLPETGGLGTLLFTLLGGSTVLGTGVVLVTKKRMSKIEDED